MGTGFAVGLGVSINVTTGVISMFKRTKVCAGVLAALGGSLLVGAPSVLAQQAGERVEITGSRLKSFETETASPIVTLGAESIKVEGLRSVEQLLNNLPQVFADYGGQVSNGATGTATVNLRNLGRSRTLVLVNGRRVPGGSPRESAADLNQIPVSLIKRVEVLTGGASAIYGSEAVAGVVNFIMNDRFEGVQLDVNHSFYNHKQKGDIDTQLAARNYAKPGSISSDGEVEDISLTLGGNFANGKGNAVLFVGYKKEAALLQSERDFSSCSLGNAGSTYACAGSSTSYPGRFLLNDGASVTVADAAGNVRAYTGSRDAYNFGPLNYFQRPSDRYTISSFGRYDINEMARVYAEVSFHDDHTVAQIAPSGLFFGNTYSVFYENPLLSQAWKDRIHVGQQAIEDANGNPAPQNFLAPGDRADILIGRRNVEGGGRQDDIRHTSFRAVSGIKGDVGPWSYDASAQVGKVIYQETYKNDFSVTRAQRALDVVDDGAGNAVCRSFLDGSDPNCVPYDIWKLGGVTQGALDYVQTPGFQKGFTSQLIYGANGSVDLGAYGLKLPTAKTGVGIAFGLESRQEKLELSTDQAFTSGDLAGQGGPTIGVAGAYSVRDIFGEVKVPIMEGQAGAELLAVSASYRNSKYSTDQKTNTYGLGLEYAPVKEAKLRGSVQRAVRAANIIELYSQRALGLYNNDSDPCAGTAPTATLTECARTGVTAAQYGSILDNPAGQYNAIFGGNPNLKPETANSFTFGLVLQPLKDLSVTADYFSVKVKDVISNLQPVTTLNQCLATGAASVCALIHRDSRGSLWLADANIVATNANLSTLETKGLDLGADYRLKVEGAGAIDLSFLGTKLLKYATEEAEGFGQYDCAGYFGNTCGTPSPKWRHKLRATWTTPWDFSLAATWRYFGGVTDQNFSDDPNLAGSTTARNNLLAQKELKAQNYVDIAGSYNLTKNVTARLAINNLFDKDPPIVVAGAPFGNGNTYPVVYDALGRRITVSLQANF
jgi:outer membrane receptor protein involved in Fe transport